MYARPFAIRRWISEYVRAWTKRPRRLAGVGVERANELEPGCGVWLGLYPAAYTYPPPAASAKLEPIVGAAHLTLPVTRSKA